MEALVDSAMREGALGVSSSLQYIPNIYSSTEELIALAKVAARYGGAYFTHQAINFLLVKSRFMQSGKKRLAA